MSPTTRTALTFVAGFCDTVTFIHMGGVLSAHVTGNFVLFAAALANGLEAEDYLKIATFPFFLLGVCLGALLAGSVTKKVVTRRLLVAITSILILISTLAIGLIFWTKNSDLGSLDIVLTLLLVIGLAIQNTIHHYFSGPMTTVMTGTVMNATASFVERIIMRNSSFITQQNQALTTNPIWMILCFAAGCITGGLSGLKLGLAAIILPAIIMLVTTIIEIRHGDRHES